MKARRLYGFIDHRDKGDGPPRARQTVLLDCVDADAFDANPQAIEDPAALALVRAISTPGRWRDHLGLSQVATECAWVELTVGLSRGEPRAWIAAGAQEGVVATNLQSISFLGLPGADTSPDQPDGIAKGLQSACNESAGDLARESGGDELSLWLAPREPLEIVALDVGQASCNAIRSAGETIGYFDVGWPNAFNSKSAPDSFIPDIPRKGIVMLSHWDFDHFELGRRHPGLREQGWFAPRQPVGPQAALFQRSLGSNLRFLHGDASFFGFLLRRATSTVAGDRNGSGLVLRYEPHDEVVVLTGDADFNLIEPGMLERLTSMVLPHHGAAASPPLPSPAGLRRAVASYGNPNRYKHPHEDTLGSLESSGWLVERTASHASNTHRRGPRMVYP